MRFNTGLLHARTENGYDKGATLSPIYQSSAFEQESAERLEKIFLNQAPGFSYTRINNPTVAAFEDRITWLEGGKSSVATSSGMAAVFNAVAGMLSAGDEIIASSGLYGGTIDLFLDLKAFGIHTHYVEDIDEEALKKLVNEHTRLVFAETIGNPKLNVLDIKKTAELVHSYGLPLLVDNTVATAYLIRPLEEGADIVINSSSKYINGSSNSISGVITDSGNFRFDAERYPGLKPYLKLGPFAYTAKLRDSLFRNTGACLAPMNAYLNMIGFETLGIRMERICKTADALAKWLGEQPQVNSVNYPGLPDSPWHEIAKKQFERGFGGIITIRLGSKDKAYRVVDHLKYAKKVSNIGDSKTLIIHPDSTIFCHSSREEKEAAGVYEDMLRISVGLEDIEDLMEDFAQALSASEE